MAVDVDVPEMGESVSEVTVLEWLRGDGDYVEKDEPICVLETDKANVDLPAPVSGVLKRLKQVDDTLEVGELLAQIEEESASATTEIATEGATASSSPAPKPEATKAAPDLDGLSPAVRRLVEEHAIDPTQIQGTGRGGRIIKQDVLAYLKERDLKSTAGAGTSAPAPPAASPALSAPDSAPLVAPPPTASSREPSPASAPVVASEGGERREPMSKIRKRIAERLVQAQRTAAMLTTFNEVDLSEVMALRSKHKERFRERHGVSLGLMSFFSRAAVLALQEIPEVNASIEGDDIVYHDYVNLGIAVSSDRGLLVPVVQQAQALTMAQTESEIKRLATAVRDNKLTLQELGGATFTITNGGVFGSLLSTPILTPPQTGILGMHAIKDRPIAVDGQIVIRPMMYVALSYDHRLVDGQQSVTFLVRLKELLDDPARLVLEV
ncbi:MAG: 2-oxoglutarate dehydrogenase complex dihydrolipoyllysine-residue succinyltransferase [Candidatus Latescibacterota bacterium]|nr:2-oxoglutarate dehydrogenase complex dihydrolipoyllysine-residue succinyltransferase [Candidatus Latescibacterota bacterium]